MTRVLVNEPLLGGNELKYLTECVETGWVSSDGPFVAKFENAMAAAAGRKHGISVCNGTVALEVALKALNIGPGDEVILPTFSIISCVAAILRVGATPVLVDSDPCTWNMCPKQVGQRITPRTRALMVVHTYGLPCEMDSLLALAKQYGLAVVEDAAEMHGQTYRTRPCGSFGDISTFSFYANKHITTGEGGMLLTDRDDLAKRCQSLRNLCFQPERRFVHEELGWNFRLSNLQAAVGLAQCETLQEHVRRKRALGAWYSSRLAGLDCIETPVVKTDYAENIYWVYGVVLKESVPFDAAEAMRRLKEQKIDTRPFFWPTHQQPVFLRQGMFAGENYPQAERLARRGFYLPSGLALTEENAYRAADALRRILA